MTAEDMTTPSPPGSPGAAEQQQGLFLPQVNAGVPEADAGEHAGQVHAGARLQILGVTHGSEISRGQTRAQFSESSLPQI